MGFLDRLKKAYNLKLVRITSPLTICEEHMMSRDSSSQFDVSEDKVRAINIATRDLKLDWCLEIDNSAPASSDEIVAHFKEIRPRGYA